MRKKVIPLEDRLDGYSDIEIYKLRLSGGIEQFPKELFSGLDGKEKLVGMFKYLIDNILKWSADDIKNLYCRDILKYYKLDRPRTKLRIKLLDLIDLAYPNKFKIIDFTLKLGTCFNKDTPIKCTGQLRYLIETRIGTSDIDIINKFNTKFLIQNKYSGLLRFYSVIELLDIVFPGRFKEWNFKLPRNYWNLARCHIAVEWLLEVKLKWTDEQIKKLLSGIIFVNNGLTGALLFFNNDVFSLINSVYPSRFIKWEILKLRSSLSATERDELLRWLIKVKLGLSESNVCTVLTSDLLHTEGYSFLYIHYKSLYNMISIVYPDRFKPWELIGSTFANETWTEDRIHDALYWLIHSHLKILNEAELSKRLRVSTIKKTKLTGILKILGSIDNIRQYCITNKLIYKKVRYDK